jgi:ribosomal protein S18 acetylase RimI-like enzyme
MRFGKTKEFLLKPASLEDQVFCGQLFDDIHALEFAHAGLQEPVLAQLMAMQRRAQTSGYAVQFPNAEDSIIWIGKERVGRVLVAHTENEMHLVDIALLSVYRGRGIGGAILRSLCDRARAASVPLRLSVRHGNPAGHLYERLKFVRIADDGMNIMMEFGGCDIPSPTNE